MIGEMTDHDLAPLHVIVINYVYDGDLTSPRQALARYPVMTGWSVGLIQAGARVTVVGRLGMDADLEHQGARYCFVADRGPPWPPRLHVPRRLHREVRARWNGSIARGERVALHVNGLLFPVATRSLVASLASLKLLRSRWAVVAQHHAEKPWSGPLAWVQRWGLASVDGFLFAAADLAQAWIEQGSVRSAEMVHEVMEASSPLQHEPRRAARARTGLTGDPVVIWTGNLNRNKDPLTIVEGFETVLEQLPRARLYMAYRYSDLLPQLETRIAGSEALRRAVTLLGEIPYDEIEPYYNSADYFVQGSTQEGSGLALLDAMACGVVPVVTDIPSFRTITDGGRIGALWPPGDVEGFAAAFLRTVERPLASLSRRARQYSERNWSAEAVGRRALAVYRRCLRATSSPPVGRDGLGL